MASRQPARRTVRRRPVPIARRVRRVIDRIDYGIKFNPSTDPPEFSRAPWWSATLAFDFDGIAPKTYRFSDVAQALNVLLGGYLCSLKDGKYDPVVAPFLIRPQTVRFWGLSKQAINAQVYEIVGAGTHRVKQLADMGSGINFSRLGWRYGVAAQIDPNNIESTPVFSLEPCAGKVLVYLQVLFCVTTGFTFTLRTAKTVAQPMDHGETQPFSLRSLF